MSSIKTQLYDYGFQEWRDVPASDPNKDLAMRCRIMFVDGGNTIQEFLGNGTFPNDQVRTDTSFFGSGTVHIFGNGDSFDYSNGMYTFAAGTENRFHTPSIMDYRIFDQPVIAGITSEHSSIESDGKVYFLSKLTSVLGTNNQLDVTVTRPGEIQLGISENYTPTIPQDLSVSTVETTGAVTIGQNVSVGHNATIGGALSVAGNSTIDGNLSVTGNVTSAGSISGKQLIFTSQDPSAVPIDTPIGAMLWFDRSSNSLKVSFP